MFLSLLFLYIIFPSVSAVIFSMFSCKDCDPDDVDHDSQLYLHSDYSISCSSSRYKAARVYSMFMVVLYPIGIPFLFFSVLYYFRNEIERRTDTSDRNQHFYLIEFLWFPFTPKFWYFEFIDIVYRVFMTGFLVLIGGSTSEKVLVGLCLSFFYAHLHQHVHPHEVDIVQKLKIVSIWQIFIYLFLILLLEEDIVDDMKVLISLMVWLTCCTPLVVTFIYGCYLLYSALNYDVHDTVGWSDRDTHLSEGEVKKRKSSRTISIAGLLLKATAYGMSDVSSRQFRRHSSSATSDNITLVDMNNSSSDDSSRISCARRDITGVIGDNEAE